MHFTIAEYNRKKREGDNTLVFFKFGSKLVNVGKTLNGKGKSRVQWNTTTEKNPKDQTDVTSKSLF